MGTFTQDLSSSMPMQPPPSSLDPNAMASLKQAQALSGGPLVQARNFAVMTGVNVGISTVLRRIKGKEDVWSRNAAIWLFVVFHEGVLNTNQLDNLQVSADRLLISASRIESTR
ncbi:uncharacterized protein LOC110704500 isoform X2 [Chenopodium quinoa]|uniref:Uncharacterized protein n=1 Tax=Chenopodium quinoa TaxID=63459 RepID=A0A803MJR9_CHEQI|nr:uncharacterized protein LOC110704500 isoform X2 [Chenopodium quinoa]